MEECGADDRQRTIGVSKGKRNDGLDVYAETVGRCGGTGTETAATVKAAGLQEQLDQEDCGTEEG